MLYVYIYIYIYTSTLCINLRNFKLIFRKLAAFSVILKLEIIDIISATVQLSTMFGILMSLASNELFMIDIALDEIMMGMFTKLLRVP
jgi:hypothetical protein